MKNLFIFLMIALISTYTSRPRDKYDIWAFAIGIPLVSFVVYGLVILMIKSGYRACQEMAMSILPAIISGAVIHFQLRKKIENEYRVIFPSILVLFVGVTFIMEIVQLSLEYKTSGYTKELSKYKVDQQKSTASSQVHQVLNVSYNGLSFSYPDNWEVSKEEIEEGHVYHVYCENNGNNNSEIITFTWTNIDVTLDEMLQFIKEGLMKESPHCNIVFEPTFDTTVKGVLAKKVNYTGKLRRQPFYGQVTTFKINDISVLMGKQSHVKSRLDTGFKTIEDSFEFR